MTQGAWGSHGTCAWSLRPFDGYMMYTDIDCKYHSLSTTFNLTLNCPLILTHAKRIDQYIIYISVTVRISWQIATGVHHCVMAWKGNATVF